MPDNLDKLTDEQLDQLIIQQQGVQTAPQDDLDRLSDEQLDQLILQQQGQAVPQAPTESPTLEAAIEGFGQAATLGFLPQIQAVVSRIVPDPTKTIDQQLEEQGFKIEDDKDTYLAARDAFLARSRRLEQQAPTAAKAGEITGALATGVLGGGGAALARGATTAARIGQAAKAGAFLGFLENPGDIEGVVDPIQVKQRIDNAVKGATIGAGLGVGVQAAGQVGKALKTIPDTVKNFAELKALKASGAMLKDFRRLLGRKRANDTGRFLLDKRIVAAGDDFESIAKKTAALREEVGTDLGDIYQKINDDLLDRKIIEKMSKKQITAMSDTSLDMPRIANELRNEIFQTLKGKPGAKSVLARIDDELKTMAENGMNLNIADVHKIRQGFDELINFEKTVKDMPLLQKQFSKIRTKLNEKIDERIKFFDDVFGSKKSSELKRLNKEFSMVADINDVVADRIARDNANAAFGLRERISGGAGLVAGATVGGPITGLALGAGSAFATRALRRWGSAITADFGNRAAKILAKDPVLMGKFSQALVDAASKSPRSYVIAIENFLNDPEFKRTVRENESRRKNR